jgi:hypothetical protein
MGVVTARIVDERGELVGALMVRPEDEVFAITSAGGVIRTAAAEVKLSGRQTMGVRLMNLASGVSVVAVARNAEAGPGTETDPGTDADSETDADPETEAEADGATDVADGVSDAEELETPAADMDTSDEGGQETGDGSSQWPQEGGDAS